MMGEKTRITLRYISENSTLMKYSANGPCLLLCDILCASSTGKCLHYRLDY